LSFCNNDSMAKSLATEFTEFTQRKAFFGVEMARWVVSALIILRFSVLSL
jgi:hypothetical protein